MAAPDSLVVHAAAEPHRDGARDMSVLVAAVGHDDVADGVAAAVRSRPPRVRVRSILGDHGVGHIVVEHITGTVAQVRRDLGRIRQLDVVCIIDKGVIGLWKFWGCR
jgi:hypothetical protein